MPHYYFHLHECGTLVKDEEGLAFTDMVEARSYAILAARDVITNEARLGRVCLSCHIEIEARDGAERLEVSFHDAVKVTGI